MNGKWIHVFFGRQEVSVKDLAILIEGLPKSFRLGHRLTYHCFSEFLENIAKSVGRLPTRLFRPVTKTPSQESWVAFHKRPRFLKSPF